MYLSIVTSPSCENRRNSNLFGAKTEDAPGGIFNSSKAIPRSSKNREIALKKFEPAITASKGQYA